MNESGSQLEKEKTGPLRLLFPGAAFVGSLIMMTIISTWGWEMFVKGHLYNCTDDVPLDFLQPGEWVHIPVAVQHVVGHRPMNEPDTIKQGWSVSGIWLVWLLAAGGSLWASILVALGVSGDNRKPIPRD